MTEKYYVLWSVNRSEGRGGFFFSVNQIYHKQINSHFQGEKEMCDHILANQPVKENKCPNKRLILHDDTLLLSPGRSLFDFHTRSFLRTDQGLLWNQVKQTSPVKVTVYFTVTALSGLPVLS